MPYAQPGNDTTLLGLMQYTNSVTQNFYGILILLLVYIGMVVTLLNKGNEPKDVFGGVGYFTAFLAVIIRIGGLIDNITMFLAFGGLAFPIIWLWYSSK